MTDTVSVSANCACGAPVTWSDEVAESDELVCSQCGAELGTFGEFKNKALDKVKDQVEDMFRDTFNGIPGIKFS